MSLGRHRGFQGLEALAMCAVVLAGAWLPASKAAKLQTSAALRVE